jgi:hypothetical protein
MTMRKSFSRPLFLAIGLAGLTLFAGCGDGDSSSSEKEEHEAAATPQKAIAEIALVRAGLAAGLAAYEKGDAQKADELVGDAYLEHFELVEGPLEEADEELNEELEELIREEIREEIKQGEKPAEVAALVEEANAQLNQAKKALKGQAT